MEDMLNNDLTDALSGIASKCSKTKDGGAFLIKLMTVENTEQNEDKIREVFKDLKEAFHNNDAVNLLIHDLKVVRNAYKHNENVKEKIVAFANSLIEFKAMKDHFEGKTQ